MKRILITGAGSYIGMSVETYLKQWPERYAVQTLDMIGDGWQEASFAGFDAVLHVAGIVHQENTKHDPEKRELYDRVNTRLPAAVAKKAREAGIRQFIFMSSCSVYGLTSPMGKPVMITKDTPLNPTDNYGISKAKAEEALLSLAEENFKLAILRPPMIYGKGCKGNYQTMARLAKKLPVFPLVENQRSMLYIDNLSEFIRLIVEDEAEGIFCPQNREYVNTSEMVNLIAHFAGRNILMIRGMSWGLKLLRPVTGLVDKAFGSLCYDWSLSDYPKDYCVKDFRTSVEETEAK